MAIVPVKEFEGSCFKASLETSVNVQRVKVKLDLRMMKKLYGDASSIEIFIPMQTLYQLKIENTLVTDSDPEFDDVNTEGDDTEVVEENVTPFPTPEKGA